MRFRFSIRSALCLTLVAAAVLYVLVFVRWNWLSDPRLDVPQIPFDAAAWKQVTDPWHAPRQATPAESYRTARSKMIEDLLKRYDFHGWTRDQVIDLLGKPDNPGDSFDQWDVVYVLGLQRAGALSCDWEALGFKLDSSGKVNNYHIAVQ
jgi:hypothetical protein